MDNSTSVSYDDFISLEAQILLTIYSILATFIGLFGNAFVIISSILFNSFGLDAVSVTFIRHLALADIIHTILRIFPMVTVNITKEWVLGSVFCYVEGILNLIPGTANINFIFTISLHRFVCCLRPFQMKRLSTRRNALIACCFIWLYSCTASACFIADNFRAVYHPLYAGCTFDRTKNPALVSFLSILVSGLPLLLVILLNIGLWVIVYKHTHNSELGSKSNNKALRTVCLVSGLFIISNLPYLASYLLQAITKHSPNWLKVMEGYFYSINAVGNPILYTIINKRFKKFVMSTLSSLLCWKRWEELTSRATSGQSGTGTSGISSADVGKDGRVRVVKNEIHEEQDV